MRIQSDKKGLLTLGNKDTRITKIGYFLRRYKIDEFPQLLNILKGDPESFFIKTIMPDKLKYNKAYIKQQSFFFDLKLIGLTIIKVITK